MKNRKHDIERYLRGELSSAEMHALEHEALNDPFLAEALEGVEQAGGTDNFLHDLHKLNRSVHERTHKRKDRSLKMWGWTAGLAATILLIAISGFMVFSLLRQQQQREREREQALSEELLLIKSTQDTLTVIFPEESIAQITAAEMPGTQSVVRRKTNGPTQRQAAREEIIEEPAAADESETARIESEPVEAPEEETALQAEAVTESSADDLARAEKKQAGDREVSRAIQGRAAGVQTERPTAVKRSGESRIVSGKVVSGTDGEGLPGVNVVIKGAGTGTVTDADGNYQITVNEENPTLQFNFIGFEQHEIRLTENKEVNVSLEESTASLSEVVVTGYGVSSGAEVSTTLHVATPAGGRSEFKDYLARAIRYPDEAVKKKVEGRVTVRFTIETSGALTNFEVVKGIGSGCEEELIRAIREGPSWQPSRRGDVPFRDKVKVRHKFELPE